MKKRKLTKAEKRFNRAMKIMLFAIIAAEVAIELYMNKQDCRR